VAAGMVFLVLNSEVNHSTCEVCCSKNIKPSQGGCYNCRDCAAASGVSVKE
jgi:hypothetical protein